MRFLQRINRGLLLTAFVLIVLIVYLLQLHFSQQAAKPRIETICKNYITAAVGYQMLPAQYRKDQPKIPTDVLNAQIEKMKTDLGSYYPKNTKSFQYAAQQMQANLENQAKGTGVIFNYSKKITSFQSFSFHYDTVTVTIRDFSNFDGPGSTAGISERTSLSQQMTDTITLQNTSDGWKILYADLQQPTSGSNGAAPDKSAAITYTVG